MPFTKNHKIRSRQNRMIRMCKRCNKHGVATSNTSGLCRWCKDSIQYGFIVNHNSIYIKITTQGGVGWEDITMEI